MKIKHIIEIELIDKPAGVMTFNEAKERCKQLGGRLPTMKELELLYAVKDEFKDKIPQSSWFWSSVEYDANNAFAKSFSNSFEYRYIKSNHFEVLCVQ